MNWIAISGSWRRYNVEVEADVRAAVKAILKAGDGIVTGGALGVDYIATQTALQIIKDDRQLRVILPTSLEIYAAHYRLRVEESVISHRQAENLIAQLEAVRNLGTAALETMAYETVGQSSYYARNGRVIETAGSLLAFQVNESAGTQDTINKAEARGLRVEVKSYQID